jgi:hypothetical protein
LKNAQVRGKAVLLSSVIHRNFISDTQNLLCITDERRTILSFAPVLVCVASQTKDREVSTAAL